MGLRQPWQLRLFQNCSRRHKINERRSGEKVMGEETKAEGDGVERDNFLPCPECGLPCEILSNAFVASEYYSGYIITTCCILGHKFQGDIEDVFRQIIRDFDNSVKEMPDVE